MAALLDQVDEQIIAVLQDDGRASLARIGTEVGLSSDAVRARINRLTADGIVKIVGVVDPASLGLSCIATVGIDLQGDVCKFGELLSHLHEVTFLAITVGDFNMLAEVAVADDNALVDVVYGTLATMDGVRHVEVWKHLSVLKWETRFIKVAHRDSQAGRPRVSPRLDRKDGQLLRALADNPRAKFSELSRLVDVPYSVARRRSLALFNSGIIATATVVNRVSTKADCLALLGIEVTGNAQRVARALAPIDDIEILIRCSGRFQLLAEVAAVTQEKLASLVDEDISDVPGVSRVALYPYARVEVLPFGPSAARPTTTAFGFQPGSSMYRSV